MKKEKCFRKKRKTFWLLICVLILIFIGIMLTLKDSIYNISKAQNVCIISIEGNYEEGVVYDDVMEKDNVEYNYKATILITADSSIYSMRFKLYYDEPADIVAVSYSSNDYFSNKTINMRKGNFIFMQPTGQLREAPQEAIVCTIYLDIGNINGKDFDIGFNFEETDSTIIKGDESRYSSKEIVYPRKLDNNGKNSNEGESNNGENSNGGENNNGENSNEGEIINGVKSTSGGVNNNAGASNDISKVKTNTQDIGSDSSYLEGDIPKTGEGTVGAICITAIVALVIFTLIIHRKLKIYKRI